MPSRAVSAGATPASRTATALASCDDKSPNSSLKQRSNSSPDKEGSNCSASTSLDICLEPKATAISPGTGTCGEGKSFGARPRRNAAVMSQGCTASYCSQGFIALNNACQARAYLWERAASAGLQRGQVLMAYMPCWMGLHAVPNTVSVCT